MPDRGPNLDNLIDRWRAGEELAAEIIYNQHRERTFRLAYALLGSAEDAEEAAQDALGYALQNINRFDRKRSKFSTWLYMITVSRSRDLLRKRRIPTISLNSWFTHKKSFPKTSPGVEEQVEISNERNTVWEAVQELSPMHREAIVLRYWGRHTYQEIGEIVGCPMKTAQSRVRLAHQKLAPMLDQVNFPNNAEESP